MYMVNIWQVPRGLLLEVHRGKSHLWQTVQKKLCLLWLHVECISLFTVTQIPPSAETLHPRSMALRVHLGRDAQSNEKLFSISSELEE